MPQAVKVGDCLHVLNRRLYHQKHPNSRYNGHDSSSDSYNQIHSIRRLLGHGACAGRRGHLHPQMPPAPQNSFLGLKDDGNNDDDCDDEGGDLFDTGLFHEDTDPNAFKLPSVFATPPGGGSRVKKGRNRLVPTVSERSFVDSNLRNTALDRRNHGRESSSIDSLSHYTSSFPRLDPHESNLVSMRTTEDFDGDMREGGERLSRTSKEKGGHSGSSRRKSSKETGSVRETPQDGRAELTSDMIRMMTLESERTGASLLMDENFVPMSVTITKLAEGQKPHQYENDLSSSISGSLSVSSRETSLASSDDRSSSCCTCAEPQPQMLPSKSACTNCLKLGSHEDWCPQNGTETDRKADLTLMCMGCGKVIWQRTSHRSKRPRGATNRAASGSGHGRSPKTPETAIAKLNSSSNESHDKRGGCSVRKPSRDARVRFDEQVTNVHPDWTGQLQHDHSPLKYNSVLEEGDSETNNPDKKKGKKKSKKLFVKRTQPNSELVQISELGVSVHKMAYDMALRDARLTGSYNKKKPRRTQWPTFTEPKQISSGTMFSYFPLLKRQRPLSENDKLAQIGLRAQDTCNVKPKDYMKHIFGNIKLEDYYPGGKKWKNRC